MKKRVLCPDNECGKLTSSCSDKFANGHLNKWGSLFESRSLNKETKLDQHVTKCLETYEKKINSVKEMSNYENLSLGSVFKNIQGIIGINKNRRMFGHYNF